MNAIKRVFEPIYCVCLCALLLRMYECVPVRARSFICVCRWVGVFFFRASVLIFAHIFMCMYVRVPVRVVFFRVSVLVFVLKYLFVP